jgi:hypothetical protein
MADQISELAFGELGPERKKRGWRTPQILPILSGFVHGYQDG